MIPILVPSYTSILSPVQEFANVLNLQCSVYKQCLFVWSAQTHLWYHCY